MLSRVEHVKSFITSRPDQSSLFASPSAHFGSTSLVLGQFVLCLRVIKATFSMSENLGHSS